MASRSQEEDPPWDPAVANDTNRDDEDDEDDDFGEDDEEEEKGDAATTSGGTASQPGKYRCDLCDFSTNTTARRFRFHRAKAHGIGREEFECPLCQKLFSSQGTVRNHVALVHEKRKGKEGCDHCPYSANTLRDLRAHVLEAHPEVEPTDASESLPRVNPPRLSIPVRYCLMKVEGCQFQTHCYRKLAEHLLEQHGLSYCCCKR